MTRGGGGGGGTSLNPVGLSTERLPCRQFPGVFLERLQGWRVIIELFVGVEQSQVHVAFPVSIGVVKGKLVWSCLGDRCCFTFDALEKQTQENGVKRGRGCRSIRRWVPSLFSTSTCHLVLLSEG